MEIIIIANFFRVQVLFSIALSKVFFLICNELSPCPFLSRGGVKMIGQYRLNTMPKHIKLNINLLYDINCEDCTE